MSVLTQMKDMLAPLGIYSLDDDSLVMHELTVYATQLEKLHDKLRIALRENFISTAQSYGLDRFEELTERYHSDLSVDERRERLLLYMTLDNNDFSVNDIRRQLTLMGVSDNFTEDFENERIIFPDLVEADDIIRIAEELNVIEDIVPSNLEIDTGFSEFDWDSFDALDFNFGTLDKMGLRFDLFENQ